MAEQYDPTPPRHEAEVAADVGGPVVENVDKDANIALDEATGTPPFVSAKVRTAVYIGALIVDALAFLVLGILGVFDILDPGKAAEVGLLVITFVNMVSVGLAVGYRPTRSGSPIG